MGANRVADSTTRTAASGSSKIAIRYRMTVSWSLIVPLESSESTVTQIGNNRANSLGYFEFHLEARRASIAIATAVLLALHLQR